MRRRTRGLNSFAAVLAMLLFASGASTRPAVAQTAAAQSRNVILVTLDGFRWQEMFTGADSIPIRNPKVVGDTTDMIRRYWHNTPQQRRMKLMPFMWTTIATQGQIYGDRNGGSFVNVTNTHRFSYPGYSEILTGFADARIDSNDKKPNPNRTVLEVINAMPAFSGRVAAFGSWDVFPFIINAQRSHVPVNAGFDTARGPGLTQREVFLNRMQQQTPSPWSSVRLDAFTHNYALDYLKKKHPRLMYIAYGETDDFAHDSKYDFYLTSATRADAFIKELWETVQSDPQYRNRTTLIITTDHGRGFGPKWTTHGDDVDGADAIWIAAIGPDTKALGSAASGQLYQNQVAATIAELLGVKYTNEKPVGASIRQITGK